MENIIEIKNLNKSFGEVKAVSDLSFTVRKGELFAFLGINGAGKSTTINMICQTLKADSGEIIVNGFGLDRSDKIKPTLGVVFQNSVLDKSLTVKDNLLSRAALYGIYGNAANKKIAALADILDFKDLLKRTVGKLSGGQLRRIDIARALLNSPQILILDEPTTGLDPKTRKLLWDIIENLRKEENMTVFLTTHYMEEAAEADYVVIIDGGRLIARGSPLELKNAYTGDFITLYGVTEKEIKALGVKYQEVRDGFKLSVQSTADATKLILTNPEIFKDYEITKGKMDDVFLAATGKALKEDE